MNIITGLYSIDLSHINHRIKHLFDIYLTFIVEFWYIRLY